MNWSPGKMTVVVIAESAASTVGRGPLYMWPAVGGSFLFVFEAYQNRSDEKPGYAVAWTVMALFMVTVSCIIVIWNAFWSSLPFLSRRAYV
jgi:hypothetical protein